MCVLPYVFQGLVKDFVPVVFISCRYMVQSNLNGSPISLYFERVRILIEHDQTMDAVQICISQFAHFSEG